MKNRFSKLLFSVAALPLLLLTGCKDDVRTAFWWMPDPWAPAQFVITSGDSTTSGGGASAGGGAVAGGGG